MLDKDIYVGYNGSKCIFCAKERIKLCELVKKTEGRKMICKNFVKVLFPFWYAEEENRRLEEITITNTKGNEKNLFEYFDFGDADLRQGVQELFAEKGNSSKIVDCYCLAYDARTHMQLPRRKEEMLQFYTRDKKGANPYLVAVQEIRMYLFESGVGFVEMECGFESSSVSDYIQCNYFLSEIKGGANYFVSSKKVWNDCEKRQEETEVRFTVKELLQNVLEHVPGVKDFYTGRSWNDTHEKGIVYSYLYLEEKPDDFESLIFNIRNNYKESYKVPQQRYKSMKQDPTICQQFDNSYWVTSYNGTINVSFKTEDETTNLFFERGFWSKMHCEYYVLFLAVLHQRFLLLKAMTETVGISNLNLNHEDTKRQLVRIRNYRLRMHKQKCRAFFEKPSYIQHVNDYYEFIKTSYCVKELYSDLSARLADLEQVCNVYVEKIKRHEDQMSKRRSAKIEIVVSVFGTLVGLVTVTNEAWGLVEKISKVMERSFSISVLIAMAVLWIPSSVVVYHNAAKKVKEIKDITDEFEREAEALKKEKETD